MSTILPSFTRCAITALLIAGAWTTMHAQTITGYRYWFDDDAANATSVPIRGGAEYTLNASLEATAQAAGPTFDLKSIAKASAVDTAAKPLGTWSATGAVVATAEPSIALGSSGRLLGMAIVRMPPDLMLTPFESDPPVSRRSSRRRTIWRAFRPRSEPSRLN